MVNLNKKVRDEKYSRINEGELRLKFNEPITGKISFADLGLKDEDLVIESGFMRLLIDIEGIGEHSYFKCRLLKLLIKKTLLKLIGNVI